MNKVAELFLAFASVSLLAVGGGTAVLPQIKTLVVETYHWIDAEQFVEIYSLGQLSPGPNMLMVSVIGLHVAGFFGALAATVGFFLPSGLLTLAVGSVWDRFESHPWRRMIQHGLAPVSIGLMLSGVYAVGHAALRDWIGAAIAVSVFATCMTTKTNPILLILGGALVGLALF